MAVEIYSWGAAQEVTGSKHFLRVDDHIIMVDCGAFQGRREEAFLKNKNWPFDATEVSAMVLSHAHFDHCGMIPMLPKKGYAGNIYSTPASRDLASLIMMDSAHIQQKDIEYLTKRAQKKGEEFSAEILYTEADVVDALQLFVTVSYNRPFFVGNGIRATFYDAGHILGSASTVFEVGLNGNPMKIAYSGDLGRKNLPILRDPEIIPAVDYLVIESTYGNRLHDAIENAKEKLASVINRTVKRGGKIIVPAFAVERTQELIYYIHLLHSENRIPTLPVYVDSPMATNATSIFRVHQECYDSETSEVFLDNHKNPFGFNNLHYITGVEESKAINEKNEPAIIISSSGMCEAGRILHHLLNNIQDSKNTVLIVGYMAEHTLGRKILEKQKEVRIFGDYVQLNAEVAVLNEFSAHADYQEIMDYIDHLDHEKLKEIFLVHGEPDAQTNLKTILENKNIKTTIIKPGVPYHLNGKK